MGYRETTFYPWTAPLRTQQSFPLVVAVWWLAQQLVWVVSITFYVPMNSPGSRRAPVGRVSPQICSSTIRSSITALAQLTSMQIVCGSTSGEDGRWGDGCVRYVPGTLPHFCWQKKHIWRNLNLQLWRVCSACVPFFRKFLDSGLNIWQDKISARSWIASHLLCLEIVCSSFVLDTCRTRTSARKECELMLSSFRCCLLRCLDAFGFPGHVFFLHVVVLGSTRCAFLEVCWTCLCEVHCCCLCCPVIINPVSSCSWCWLDDCVSMWLCSVWAIDGCGM